MNINNLIYPYTSLVFPFYICVVRKVLPFSKIIVFIFFIRIYYSELIYSSINGEKSNLVIKFLFVGKLLCDLCQVN